MPVEYKINEDEVVKDPKGLVGNKLTVKSVISVAPKKNVYAIFSILDNMGIKVSDISFNSLADYHEFKTDDMDEEEGALINIGDEKTEVSIINKGTLIATQVLEMGGKDIDKEIMYAYNIDRKTARKLKETFALAHTDNASTTELEEVVDKSGVRIKINQYEITEIIYNKLRSIFEISKKQINLLTKKENSYIIITGGTTEIKDVSKVVDESFGKIGILASVDEIGVRNNKFSSALGLIKYYYRKLSFRKKNASTITEDDQEIIFNNKKKNKDNTLLGKVFSYFFDN
jgi:cell division protein FtsA